MVHDGESDCVDVAYLAAHVAGCLLSGGLDRFLVAMGGAIAPLPPLKTATDRTRMICVLEMVGNTC